MADADGSRGERAYEYFDLSISGSVATVMIDRPEKRNALTIGMWQDLSAICGVLCADRTLRAVVVTGAGSSFCAGADISALSEDDQQMKTAVYDAETALRELPVPTIAKIRGYCMGGGNQIAVACDLRVADTSAVLAIPPAKLSVVYAANSTRALVELIGPSAAKRLIFTAVSIGAPEALRIGLLDQVCAADELDDVVADLVASMLPLAPLTQAASKALINTVADGGDAEASYRDWYAEWASAADGIEGPLAFLQKRKPNFSWRPGD